MNETSPAALVLLSGGLDSTTLLHHVSQGRPAGSVHTLAFDYGQRHRRELECAAYQARAAGAASHELLDLSGVAWFLARGTALVAGGAEVPDLADVAPADRAQPPTYVPNRNMVLLSLAASYAESMGVRTVYYGAQAMDEYGYWDCTAEFVGRMNATLSLNRRNAVEIVAPFIAEPKSALVRRGLELGVDYAHTWSCYRGGARPCGACPTCVERANAFADAGAEDPLLKR